MRTSRRGFLSLVGSAAVLGLGPPGRASVGETALGIHRATRNTRLGAIGRLWSTGSRPPPPKRYPGARRVGLAPVEGLRGRSLIRAVRSYREADGFRAESISLQELTRLLYFANGVTGHKGDLRLRAAPSAGALYAGEVYVIAQRVQDLPPGTYHYDVLQHALFELRSGAPGGQLAQAVERGAAVDAAPAIVLLTNVFQRYTHRYANRGYRYALIDSGHIGENLRLAAQAAELAETSPLRFHDDRLNERLGIDGRQEAVCALHAIGRASQAGAKEDARRAWVEVQGSPEGPAIERYHQATKLVPGERLPEPEPPEHEPGPGSGEPAERSRDALASMKVEETIRRRRSASAFADDPIARDQLDFVLEVAKGFPRLQRAPGVGLRFVVHRVKGLESGLYRYEAREGKSVLLRGGDLRASLTQVCLGQRKAGEAAVGFLLVAELAAAARRGGARSYRDLLVEAGAIAQRIYLAAEAAGMVARNLAAFFDDDLNAFAGLDGRRQAVIHLTLLGNGS